MIWSDLKKKQKQKQKQKHVEFSIFKTFFVSVFTNQRKNPEKMKISQRITGAVRR